MLIGWIKRVTTKPAAARRFEAATGGRRFAGHQSFGNANAEILAAHGVLRSRAAFAYNNNPWAYSAVEAKVSAIVGSGIRAASGHPDADVRNAVQRVFARWAPRADADGTTDFYGLQAIAVRTMIVSGECFALLIPPPAGLRVRLIDPELIDASDARELGDGRRIVAGIEFAADGTRLAYYLSRRRPTDLFAGTYAAPMRVPATDMIHLFNPIIPGQVRGLSALAPVLLRLNELDQIDDAQLLGVKVSAMHAGFMVDLNGTATAPPFDGTQTGNILETGLEPATLKILPPGFDI